MAEEAGPADQGLGEEPDSDPSTTEMSLTDLIDQIERAAFLRALDSRHGGERDSLASEPASA